MLSAKNLPAGNSEGPQSRRWAREFANISPPGCPKSEMPRRLYLPTSVQWEPCRMVVISPTFLPLITCPARFRLGSILQFDSVQAGQWLNNGETGTAEVTRPSRRTPLSQQCFFKVNYFEISKHKQKQPKKKLKHANHTHTCRDCKTQQQRRNQHKQTEPSPSFALPWAICWAFPSLIVTPSAAER